MSETIQHILTPTEAYGALKISSAEECPNFEMFMSAVDDGIKTETGFDWAKITETYTTVDPTAKIAASLLLISLNDNLPVPAAYGYKITQLDAKVKSGEVA